MKIEQFEENRRSTVGKVLLLILLGLALTAARGAAEQLSFQYHPIAGGLPGSRDINVVGDVDGDGDLDIVQTGYYAPALWFENQYPGDWVTHVIDDDHAALDPYGSLWDIDADGDLDLVAGGTSGAGGGGLYWWQCPEDPREPWTQHTIESFGGQHHDTLFGDVDRDGEAELVFWHQESSRLYWVNIPPDPTVSPWPDLHTIQNNRKEEGLAIADIDDDGDNDVVAGTYWYEAPADPTSLWFEHQVTSGYVKPRAKVGDIDGNGSIDIVLSEGEENQARLAWFEATDPKGPWTEHVVLADLYHPHTLEVVDIDEDGDLDIFTGEMDLNENPDAKVFVFQNEGGGVFIQNIIHTGIGIHEGRVADIDGDGNLDIIGKTFQGDNENNAEWWENISDHLALDRFDRVVLDSEKGSRTLFVIPADINNDGIPDLVTGDLWYDSPGNATQSWGKHPVPPLGEAAIVYDFDHDGDLDLFGTKGSGGIPNNDLLWMENQGGGASWILHDDIPSLGGDFLQGAVAAQLVAGGNVEIALSWHESGHGVQLLEIPDDPKEPWSNRVISTISQDEEVTAGDIDGDGDLDLMLGTIWLENPEDSGPWPAHTLAGADPIEFPDRNCLVDMDGDLDLDVVVGEESIGAPGDLVWFENPPNPTLLWPLHAIAAPTGPMSLDVADMDNDGDWDVVIGEYATVDPLQGRVIVYENQDDAATWVENVVDVGDEHHGGTQLVDVDLDGDLDIASLSWTSPDILLLYVNRAELADDSGGPDLSGIVSDDFIGCELNTALWTVVDPVGDGLVTVTRDGAHDAHLQLSVPADTWHDVWRNGNNGLRLMQPAEDTDFEIEIKFDSPVTEKWQIQGLLVEQDLDRYLRFNFQSDGQDTYLFAAALEQDIPTTFLFEKITDGVPLYMRVQRQGDQWTQWYSYDGLSWFTRVTFNYTLQVTSVGIVCGNAGEARLGLAPPAHTALVDYFFNTAVPIIPEDDPAALQGSSALALTVIGDGTVELDPDKALYAPCEEVTLTALPALGAAFEGWGGDLTGTANPATLVMNVTRAVTATFVTDTTPPLISGVEVDPGSQSALVTWLTDEPATSEVSVGESTGYELGTQFDSALVTEHAMTLTGLSPDTLYHFQVASEDAGTLRTVSGDDTFLTLLDDPGPSGILSDDFNGCGLNLALWEIQDPLGDGTVEVTGQGTEDARLELTVPGGTAHDVWRYGNDGLRVMQPAADGDFELEVKFDSPMTQKWQVQGLLVEESVGRYLRLNFQSDDQSTYVLAASLVNDNPTTYVFEAIPDGTPLYMRVRRQGDQWTQWYSYDGVDWTESASFTFGLTVQAVGPFAANAAGSPVPAHTALIDYFFNTAVPIIPEDDPAALQGSSALALTIIGDGTVELEPDKALYAPCEVVTLTAVPGPSAAFEGWSGDLTGTVNPATIVMSVTRTVTATFATDTTPPLISGIEVAPAAQSALVTWLTDEPATSEVSVGESPGYELGTQFDPALVTEHAMTLTGLLPDTLYHFQVASEDAGTLRTVSGDDTFSTLLDDPGPSGILSDDFNGCGLNLALWEIQDPMGDGTVEVTGQGTEDVWLELTVPGGTAHDVWRQGNDGLRVLQPAADADFELEIKFDSSMTQRWQVQGLLVEESTDRYLRFNFQSDGQATYVLAASLVKDNPTTYVFEAIPDGTPLYMRVRRQGDQWTQWYSYDGVDWTESASFTFGLTVQAVGPFAANAAGSPVPAHTALIDYFFNTAVPIIPEDDPAALQGSSALALTIIGDGTVELEPDKALYAPCEVVTLTAVPGPSAAFEGWSDDLTGTANPATIVMSVTRTVTATFATDTTPPLLSNITVTPGAQSALVTWLTDEPATSELAVGESGAYELGTQFDPALVTEHAMTITGLLPDTLYHFQVASEDAGGLRTASDDDSFVTLLDDPGPSGILSDDFNECGLNLALWEIQDPLGDGTVDVTGQGTEDVWLELTVPGGAAHDPWRDGNGSLRVMQPAADADFELEIKFDSPMTQRWQVQGLLVEESANRYLRLNFQSDGQATYVLAASLVNDNPTTYVFEAIPDGTPLYMRVRRQGDQWTQWYSYDGQAWTESASFTFGLTVQAVGPFAANAGSPVPAHTALVDYFFNTAVPIIPEDDPAALQGSSALALTVIGDGTVELEPDKALYAPCEVVTLTAVAGPDAVFEGWSGDLTGTANPATLVMSVTRAVTATFTGDSFPPVISNIEVAPGAHSALVTWLTDEPATSELAVGESAAYELGTQLDPALVSEHAMTITGLLPGTLYHFQVASEDEGGLRTASSDDTFITLFDDPGPSGILSDDFNSCGLNVALWAIEDPLGDGTIEVTGQGTEDVWLELTVPGGVEHDPWREGNHSLRVMQPAVDADFELEVKFDSPLTQKWQLQGLLVEQDLGRYLRFNFQGDGQSAYVFAASLVNDNPTTYVFQAIPEGVPLYMRVRRQGDQWTQWYSYDGQAWTESASFTFGLTVNAVGLFSANARATSTSWPPAHTTLVDYFFNTAIPIVPEDDPAALQGSSPLSVTVIGNGTVEREPDKPLYAPCEVVTLTAVPGPSTAFEGWSGDLTGTANPATLVMSVTRALTATFVTDTTPPFLSGIGVLPGAQSALVTWLTDEPSTSVVAFGESTAYELGTQIDSALVSEHAMTLTGLLPSTLYHFQVASEDAGGWSATSSDRTFVTLANDPGPSGILSDDFNTFGVNPTLWTITDPVAGSIVTSTGVNTGDAQLSLSLPAGISHNIWRDGNHSVRVMQPAADADFELEVKFDSPLTQKWQLQGLVVEQDLGRYLRFNFQGDGQSTYVFAASLVNDNPTTHVFQAIPDGVPLYMRVRRQGDQWTQWYSYDGVDWTQSAAFNFSLTVQSVGVFAGNERPTSSGRAPAHTALADYFFNTAAPSDPEDGGLAVDDRGPRIYGVEIIGSTDKIKIRFGADEPTMAIIDYGTTLAYELGSLGPTEADFLHNEMLFNLSPETAYHLRIVAEDLDAHPTISDDFSVSTLEADNSAGPDIDVWYGNKQAFGLPGNPQVWANVLGQVSDPNGVSLLTYSLNGGPEQALTLGTANLRLPSPGDFNAEIGLSDLTAGRNDILLTARDNLGNYHLEFFQLDYFAGNTWPLPYAVDWSSVARIRDVAQVVDGLWTLEGDKVRTVEFGYDRMLTIGDLSWEDYEVTVDVVINAAPPQFDGMNRFAAVALRWPGHYDWGGSQPRVGWYPIGSVSGYWWGSGGDRWRIGGDEDLDLASTSSSPMQVGVPYTFKVRVETLPGTGHLYQFKAWESALTEPGPWKLEALVPPNGLASGSILLIGHRLDISFGDVSITPLGP